MEWLCGGGVKVIRVRAKVQIFVAERNGANVLSFSHIFTRVWKIYLGNFFVTPGSFRLAVAICWRGIAYPKLFFPARARGFTQNAVGKLHMQVFSCFLVIQIVFHASVKICHTQIFGSTSARLFNFSVFARACAFSVYKSFPRNIYLCDQAERSLIKTELN